MRARNHIQEPFDPLLADHILSKLDNTMFVTAMCEALKALFRYDPHYSHAQVSRVIRLLSLFFPVLRTNERRARPNCQHSACTA